MLQQGLDNRFRIAHEIIRIKPELLELGILSHEILNRILKRTHQLFKSRTVRRGLDVEDNLMLDVHILGDRQGVLGRPSVWIMVNRYFRHRL